ncbi:FxsA family protein [Paraconexibacter sp.]|uniref:FxsA family protein n=1 Tax=Paraconexibacter sp. TaxID=2949640 RepID=UPI003566BDD7
MPLLILLFLIVPIAELYVIIQVGQAIGALNTVGILILDSIVGSLLLRSQGRAVWRRFNDALAAGRAPAREVLDGVLVIFGGALLITPGFLSDVFGILMLAPPSRVVIRRILTRRLTSRAAFVVAGPAGAAGADAAMRARRRRRPGRGDDVVDGTATEIDDSPRELP